MRKFFTLALAAFAAMNLQAGEFTVFENGTLAQDVSLNYWWNATYTPDATNPDGDGKVFSFKTSDGGAAGSMGFMTNILVAGPLNTATLSFDYYAIGTGEYTIRLTSPDTNQTFTVTAENAGKWNSVSYSVPEQYAAVAQTWKTSKDTNADYFIFSVVLEKGSADAQIYFNNIKYTNTDDAYVAPEVEVIPVPETVPSYDYPAADVVSLLSGQYTAATTFGIGGWGQSTKATPMNVDQAPVYQVLNFNYLGWELADHINVSDCDYMHVDYYNVAGTTFGFTPISPEQEKANNYTDLALNQWHSFDVALSYYDNVDFTDLFQVKFDNGNGGTGYIANVFFYKKDNGGEQPDPVDPDPVDPDQPGATFIGSTISKTYTQTMNETEGPKEYPYTLDYTIVYNADKTLTVAVTYNWANGEPVGAENFAYMLINGAETQLLPPAEASQATAKTFQATTAQTYEAGASVPVHFKLPVALGAVEDDVPNYIIGSSSTSGIEAVEAEAEAVEYFNLQGIRVANPENGIFIRRQGNKVTKVIK